MQSKNITVVVAGSTGNLGKRIVHHLLKRKAKVRALVRNRKHVKVINDFISGGVEVREVDYNNPLSITEACLNAGCVVSALSGVRDVIVEGQSKLLYGAIEAGVRKFIPSDYCIDYRNLPHGNNRNLDLRREFADIISKAPIKSTSILNGMFTDLLIGDAPVILFKQKRIFFWGNADQKMDFTSVENTAEYAAAAALDENSPRWLTIAGETASMRDLQRIATEVTGEHFKLLRPGGLSPFKIVIKVTKTLAPGKNEAFPAWQGMQYLYDMLTGKPKFKVLENDRYNGIRWERISEILKRR
jgi:uncharacterized protein YbjT (DUF2867 family)